MMQITALEHLRTRIAAVKGKAGFFVTQRRKDVELYGVLAECLALCETAERDGLTEALRQEVCSKPLDGRNRSYVEGQSDIFLIVGRLVFEPETARAATWRYSATLREASKAGIHSASLVDVLRSGGGINAFFRGRPVKSRTCHTKTLHLNAAIEVPKDADFTVTLRRDARGFFDVVSA